jgi:hypothetical protein
MSEASRDQGLLLEIYETEDRMVHSGNLLLKLECVYCEPLGNYDTT